MQGRVREVAALATAVRDGAFVIDVREPEEHESGRGTWLDARTVAGGTQAWISAGYPVIPAPRAARP